MLNICSRNWCISISFLILWCQWPPPRWPKSICANVFMFILSLLSNCASLKELVMNTQNIHHLFYNSKEHILLGPLVWKCFQICLIATNPMIIFKAIMKHHFLCCHFFLCLASHMKNPLEHLSLHIINWPLEMLSLVTMVTIMVICCKYRWHKGQFVFQPWNFHASYPNYHGCKILLRSRVGCVWSGTHTLKASANKIKTLVILIWTPQHFTYFGWTFAVEFFILGVLGVIDPRKKFEPKSSSEVRKMLGCSNQRYENFDFIRRCLLSKSIFVLDKVQGANVNSLVPLFGA